MIWGTPSAKPEPPGHTCPRCDYDQRGQIDRWSDECPLQGVCSECGLAFEWVDVLRPRRNLLVDFVEHEQARTIVPAAWRTLWWAMRPRTFWSLVRLEHRPKISRMLVWILIVMIAPRFIMACAAVGVHLWNTWRGLRIGAFSGLGDSLFRVSLDGIVAIEWNSSIVDAKTLALPAGMVAFTTSAFTVPAVLMCLPWTRARAKVHRGHISRATTYSFAPVGAVLCVWAVAALVWCAFTLFNPSQQFFPPFRHAYWGYSNLGERALHIASRAWVWGGWIAAVWLIAWWWAALSRGFRIEGSRAIMAVLVVCAALASAAAVALSHPMIAVSVIGED